jgi:hypothetical protein
MDKIHEFKMTGLSNTCDECGNFWNYWRHVSDENITHSSATYARRSLNTMGRVRQWFSSKLGIEDGQLQEADAYAGRVGVDSCGLRGEGYYMASVALPAYCYVALDGNEGFFATKTRAYPNDENALLLVDFDENGVPIGVEFLVESIVTYDEQRES